MINSKIIFSWVCLALAFVVPSPVYAEEGTVLVIESYHDGYPWDRSYKDGLVEVLGDQYRVESFEMDTKRIPLLKHAERADLAWAKYLELIPDLVVLGDDNAMRLLAPRFLMVETPVVYLGVNSNPRNYYKTRRNITGVLERPLMRRSVSMISRILGLRKGRVMVLFDSGHTSRVSVDEFFEESKSMQIGGLTVDLKLIDRMQDWKETVSSLKAHGYDAVVVGLYQTLTDETKVHVPAVEVMSWTSENTPVPPFAFWDFAVGGKATIGGLVLHGRAQGLQAGKIALEILGGADPAKMLPVVGEEGRYLFSKFGLKRWGIHLPEDNAERAEYVD